MKLSKQFREMEKLTLDVQKDICRELEKLETVFFREDIWQRPEGGGGRTRVIECGKTFEKVGVNTSTVNGMVSEALAEQLNTKAKEFAACGLSIVIHPVSPKIPTIHLNVRYFELEDSSSWFGGGMDLTPYYPYVEDFTGFHLKLKNLCEEAIPGSYEKYKSWCDEYFTIKHRNEMRGIGGVFFDYLDGKDNKNFMLAQSLAGKFNEIYIPIVKLRMDEPYGEEDRKFQLIRRGRYVEFNLIYDRGTVFGLKSNGRTESILMSLPPVVNFNYDWKPETGSPHEEMLKYYQPRDWVK